MDADLLQPFEEDGRLFTRLACSARDDTGRVALADEIAARWDPLPGEPLAQSFRYPFLSPSIARAVMSDIGQLAAATAL